MAVAPRRARDPRQAPSPDEVAFSQLFGMLAANPAVQTIATDPLGRYIDLWVRLDSDNEAREMAVNDALDAYHGTEGVATPVDIHMVLASEPDSAFPPDVRPMYRRR